MEESIEIRLPQRSRFDRLRVGAAVFPTSSATHQVPKSADRRWIFERRGDAIEGLIFQHDTRRNKASSKPAGRHEEEKRLLTTKFFLSPWLSVNRSNSSLVAEEIVAEI
jgi:hypothetical protein